MKRYHGVELTVPEDAVAIGFQTPLMGWSWAVLIAQWTLEDMLAGSISVMKASNRLTYRRPPPPLEEEPTSLVHWEFIDDVGAMMKVENTDLESGRPKAVGQEIRAKLSALGLGFHKDEYGPTVTTLGHELSPETFGV